MLTSYTVAIYAVASHAMTKKAYNVELQYGSQMNLKCFFASKRNWTQESLEINWMRVGVNFFREKNVIFEKLWRNPGPDVIKFLRP